MDVSMSEPNIKKDDSSFIGGISAVFTSIFTTSTLNGFEMNYSFFIGSFDIIPGFMNFIIFSLLFYPFHRFFKWLYSASPKKPI
jgi:hypothetical protein